MYVCVVVSINIECIDTLGCRILSSGCKQILCVFLGCSSDNEAAAAVPRLAQVSCLSLTVILQTLHPIFFLYFSSILPTPSLFPPHSHNVHLSRKKLQSRLRGEGSVFLLPFFFFLLFTAFSEPIRRCQEADKTASWLLVETQAASGFGGGKFKMHISDWKRKKWWRWWF